MHKYWQLILAKCKSLAACSNVNECRLHVYYHFLLSFQSQYQLSPGVFDGCINRVTLNGQKQDLWSPMVESTSEANFCPSAGTPPNYPRRIPGVTFGGLSYLVSLPPNGLDFSVKSQMSIKFRTFSPTAVVFTIQDSAASSYYGIFLQNGRVIFQYGSSNDLVSLTSDNVYNDGDWYTVSELKYLLSVGIWEEGPKIDHRMFH